MGKIKPNKNQPRKIFKDESIIELSKSIKNQGLLVPIIVNEDKKIKNNYIIVAGERRWRAAKLAGLSEIQVIVNKGEEKASSLASLIENVQREDLSPLEEGQAYQNLVEKHKMTHEEISKYSGKSRSYITNLIRILDLPKRIKTFLAEGKISFGHARSLLSLKEEEMHETLENIMKLKLSVRDTEDMVKSNKKSKINIKKDVNILEYEKYLSLKLGYQVTIKDIKGNGTLSVKYKTLEQLEEIVKLFNS